MKHYKMGGKADTGTAKRNPKSPPLSPDVEADLKALETLEQPDYDVGGPKRRYRKGKEDKYKDMPVSKRLKATAWKVANKTLGKVADIPFDAANYVNTKIMKDPEGRRVMQDLMEKRKKIKEDQEEGAYFKKGGSVSSASKRADGCVTKGKTRGKFV